jgi:hypothetical protein
MNEWLAAGAGCLALLAAVETGYRIGRRLPAQGEAAQSHVGALQGAALGLLALLLAFTFSMAVSRYDTRKHLVMEEANAIGTTALRTSLLPEPQREQARAALKTYVAARLAFYEAGEDSAQVDAALASTAREQRRLWSLATDVAALDPRSVPAGLFVQTLNDSIDLAEKRLVALESHVPGTVMALLLIVSTLSFGYLGYGSALAGARHFASTGVFALLVTLVVTIILDIDRPRGGLIRVSQASMQRLAASLDPEPGQQPGQQPGKAVPQ